MAEENDNIIVSRIQHRRGLKQDLPQPLRPGELGLATDSRQVYIGGDPNDPASADYNAVSYFENTVGAREHTISIANNLILAFQVPFIKYSRGEYNGTQTEKGWRHNDSRSILPSSTDEKQYMSRDYTVFKSERISTFEHTLLNDLPSTGTVVELKNNVNYFNDNTGYIRIGDKVTGANITGELTVTDVTKDNSTGVISVTLDTAGRFISANSNITFTPNNIINFSKYDMPTSPRTPAASEIKLSQASFVSSDVSVHKNGIKLVPESNSSIVDVPSASFDYVIDGSNVSSQGTHFLNLRTRPDVKDELTLCYYSNANVIQSIQGISTGKVAAGSTVDSFYTAYNIPSSRQIPTQNIRVNETTGLGYIGLQHKHITAVADGANISSPNALSLGNLLISRVDEAVSTSNVVLSGNTSTTTTFIVNMSEESANIYSPVNEVSRGTYRYNRIHLKQNAGNYLHDKTFDVEVAATGQITFELPGVGYQINRPCTANINYSSGSSNFTDTLPAPANTIIDFTCTEIDGVKANDYIRILDRTGNPGTCELHGAVFKVTSVTPSANKFTVDIATAIDTGNTLPDFTANIASLYFINHGALGNVNTTAQFRSVDHNLTPDVSTIKIIDESATYLNVGDEFDVYTRSGEDNTFFGVTKSSGPNLIVTDNDMSAASLVGEWHPLLSSLYNNYYATPVLAIDLSDKTTLKDVLAVVNKPLVEIPRLSTSDVQIFPVMDYLPQDNGVNNRVFVSQRPAYDSISVGGLEFRLSEDSAGTLATLGLTAGVYDRDSSVRAKLEAWLNDMVVNRDINLFTNVLLGGTAYNSNSNLTNYLGRYNLTIDETFGEVLFADRQEAANFNFITNSAYSESAYDRASDSFEGTRGVVNLKNNLELQTRDTASTGEKIVTYSDTEGASLLQSYSPGQSIITLNTNFYDTYFIEYTMSETPIGGVHKYMRQGIITVQGRGDFSNPTNAVILNDRFTSHWETTSTAAFVEPKFVAEMDSGNKILIKLDSQLEDPTDPTSNRIAFSLQANIKLKYIVRRWSSIA